MTTTSLKDQRIVVIGGSSGIGFAVACGAIAEGAQVTIASSNASKVDAAVKKLAATASGKVVDVIDDASVAAFFDTIEKFDHLVFTAGEEGMGHARGSLAQIDIAAAETDLKIRFWGALRTIKQARSRISANGSITLTDGVLAQKPAKGFPLGSAFGGMIEHLARGLAVDMAPIRVNSVCPGLVHTERLASYSPELIQRMTEHQLLPRAATPDEAAQAYLYLMRSSYTTGQIIVADGGRSLI